jgi:hypothetical protein
MRNSALHACMLTPVVGSEKDRDEGGSTTTFI